MRVAKYTRWLAAAAVGAALAAGAWYWIQERRLYESAELLRRLPADEAVVVSIDFSTLRIAGLLQLLSGAGPAQEPEYRTFLQKTGFDYQRDLDRVLASFRPGGVYILARGRFDWNKLEAYAKSEGGTCAERLCRMAGSQAERRISFYPLRRDLMALAVSSDGWAATRLSEPRAPASFVPPADPLWLYLTRGALRDPERFPEGTRLFIKALEVSDGATLTVGPAASGFRLKMEAACRGTAEAKALHSTLEKITQVLGVLIRRESKGLNPDDLSGVLASGKFQLEGRAVRGTWALTRKFVEGLASPPK
ncbi:MAG: hypothetical protein ACKV22_06680 [Bryobacteraceae bacterium]